MHTEKLSISLKPDLVALIDRYRAHHAIGSRSKVIEEALLRLRQEELENAYREASMAENRDSDVDAAIGDGLSHEAW